MFKNLLKYSFRSLRKQKSFVFINVIGLSIGLVCSIIIALFILFELSYDQYNDNKDRIYRVILNGKLGGQEVRVTSTASVIAAVNFMNLSTAQAVKRAKEIGTKKDCTRFSP